MTTLPPWSDSPVWITSPLQSSFQAPAQPTRQVQSAAYNKRHGCMCINRKLTAAISLSCSILLTAKALMTVLTFVKTNPARYEGCQSGLSQLQPPSVTPSGNTLLDRWQRVHVWSYFSLSSLLQYLLSASQLNRCYTSGSKQSAIRYSGTSTCGSIDFL